jgi:uncharacterized membrane protein YiaA
VTKGDLELLTPPNTGDDWLKWAWNLFLAGVLIVLAGIWALSWQLAGTAVVFLGLAGIFAMTGQDKRDDERREARLRGTTVPSP